LLQKDGFFRNRRDESFRQNQPIAPAPATAANTAGDLAVMDKSASAISVTTKRVANA